MNSSPALDLILPGSRQIRNSAFSDESGENNSQFFGNEYTSGLTSESSNEIKETNCSALHFPSLASQPSPANDTHPLLTKPKLLRKKDLEIKRYKELALKTSMDCANAISGEQLSMAREGELKRKLHELKIQNEAEKRVEKLRNKERLLNETEQLRWQRDEARMHMVIKDSLIKRLRMKVGQLEELEKQKEKELNQLKRELDNKNVALKNLLRKLVLAKFSKKRL